MTVRPPGSFADDLHRRVYEYVERNGAVDRAELIREIRLESDESQSKPARSGTYTEPLSPPTEDLESCLGTLIEEGYLVESEGKLRLSVSATPTELESEDGTVTIRPAREEDRMGIVETMRTVADEGTYIVAENVATRIERDSALMRANAERSRVCFVASLDREHEQERDQESTVESKSDSESQPIDDRTDDSEVIGWLHLDAHELPSLSHTAELTVGVEPDYRRRGIGSALIEYGLEWAGDAGYRKVYQNVPATNEVALEFLENNGWQREGVHEEQYRIDDAFVDEVMLARWPESEP